MPKKIDANRPKKFRATDFDSVTIKLTSPERILDWSWGEVTKPETINYRTQRSEKQGLFDEKIFGPERDYECNCGKYKGVRYKGIVCEKCGVELTRSIVRRERIGHISLASPVSHVWFLRGVPSRMALVLGIKTSDLEKVIYFSAYIVTKVTEDERFRLLAELDQEFKAKIKTLEKEEEKDQLKEAYLKTKSEIETIAVGHVVDELAFNRFVMRYGSMFEAQIGAEAIYNLMREIDLEELLTQLLTHYDKTKSRGVKAKLAKRISTIRSLIVSESRPEWMFLKHLPVLPCGLRPMVALEGGRHATSDVNDLYRRVINRNNRLKKLMSINAPHVILRNEKRILQEAVDALLDNSIRRASGAAMALNSSQKRALKSLADNLKGKQGLLRQNLLGKRVDYSARSVIVVGPTLKLDECGIPKFMALELFRPFVVSKLIEQELAFNIRGANKLIDDGIGEVWAILEQVIEGKYVLLNRAPTLHRLGIQAFRPILIEGRALQLHPLVCAAFNADFDGDQMAVHLPLSIEAQAEARTFMAADKNILKPGSGNVITKPSHDIVLGVFWMTKVVDGARGEGKIFASPNEAITTYDFGGVDLRAKIIVAPTDKQKYIQFEGKPFETTIGRLLFNTVLPSEFPYFNDIANSKVMQKLIAQLIAQFGMDSVPKFLDKIKAFGFRYATKAGITWSLSDVKEPKEKKQIIKDAEEESDKVRSYYEQGLLSDSERKQQINKIWLDAKDAVTEVVPAGLDPMGPVYDMVMSGARGSAAQLTQIAGFKGLILNNKGEKIEFPVKTGSLEGHSPLEYFITTHGSRKGLADTALNTANAGYLTRKLFDVSQDVVIHEEDCGTEEFITLTEENLGGIVVSLADNIDGRFVALPVFDPTTKEVLIAKNGYIDTEMARKIEALGIKEVSVYSPLTSKSVFGLSQKCYGKDLSSNVVVDLGEAVGTIAAQAIGEPGTQLTMRTFHDGGTASKGGDIVQGLPRVVELFERRIPKNPAVISHVNGTIVEVRQEKHDKIVVVLPNESERNTRKKDQKEEYLVNYYRTLLVDVGDTVKKGQILTDGSANISELFDYGGKTIAQEYIIREIRKIYELQGSGVSRKHIELIVAQMFSRVKVIDRGDSAFSDGDIIEKTLFERENEYVKEMGAVAAKAQDIVLGISEVALSRESFLSAASFQHTSRIFIDSAMRGSVDYLRGLKENVIIGRLIPAGTGFKGSKKHFIINSVVNSETSRIGEDDFEII